MMVARQLLAASMLFCNTMVQAAVITWNLTDVVFEDGGSASGFLQFDPDLWTSTGEGLRDFDIKMSGGNTTLFPAIEYTPDSSIGHAAIQGANFVAQDVFHHTRQLNLFPEYSFDRVFKQMLGTLSNEEIIADPNPATIWRYVRGPSITPVPEASAFLSLSIGLALGLIGYRSLSRRGNFKRSLETE